MAVWPVIQNDGVFQAMDEQGRSHPLTMGGTPLRGFNPGWYPVGLHPGLAPLHLLELACDAGPEQLETGQLETGQLQTGQPETERRAVWYLGGALDFLGNHPRHFTPEARDSVIAVLLPLLRDVHELALCAPRAERTPAARRFGGIDPAWVRELVGFVAEQVLTPPDCVSVDRFSGLSDHYMADGVRISLPTLDILLAEDGARLMPHALLHGSDHAGFEVASPFGGGVLRPQQHVLIGGEQAEAGQAAAGQAWRFYDRIAGFSFYLMQRTGPGQICLFVPGLNLGFARGTPPDGRGLLVDLLAHYAASAPDRTGAMHLPATPIPPRPLPTSGSGAE